LVMFCPHYSLHGSFHLAVCFYRRIIHQLININRLHGRWYALLWLIVSPWLHAVTLRHLSEFIHSLQKLRLRLRLYVNRARVLALQQKRAQLQVRAPLFLACLLVVWLSWLCAV
jgi:hypothetical protein